MASTRRPSRKSEILDRAAELIATKGYDETSLRELAEVMGMSKGTILHHYGTKERLLERIHESYMKRRLAEAELILAAFDTPAERLAALVYQLMLLQASDRSATVAFAREIVRFASDDLMEDVRHMRGRYSELLEDVISQGVEQGDFNTADPQVVALMIFGMCNWSWTWFDTEGRLSAEAIAEIFTRTLLHGISGRDGVDFSPGKVAEVVSEAIRNVAAETNHSG
jgi:AcrR family transcriptional regulator